MIYYVYRTTNLINGKYYIGKHASTDFDPNYLGSGLKIKNAIRKYGKSNFKVEVIKTFINEEEAFNFEKQIIETVLGNPDCYNIVDGGKGFTSRAGKRASDKAKEKGIFGFRTLPRQKFLEIASSGGKAGSKSCQESGKGLFGMTYEDRSKWSTENNKDRQWITNGNIDLRIKKSEPMPEGFYIGRSKLDMSSRTNFLCWTNGLINIFAYECPGPDFRNGMIKSTPTANLPWWNNGTKNKRSVEQPGPDFVPGRLKWKSKIVTCPHCGKTGGETAMKQHHFDHCKMRNKHD